MSLKRQITLFCPDSNSIAFTSSTVTAWASPPGGKGGCRGVSARFKNMGGCPPRNRDFLKNYLNICLNFHFFQYFPKKVVEIREEIGIWGVGFGSPKSVSQVAIRPPSRNFVATPLVYSAVFFYVPGPEAADPLGYWASELPLPSSRIC